MNKIDLVDGVAKQKCPQCKRVKRNGERCKKLAVTGYEVCGSHGAGSPFKGRPGMINKKYLLPDGKIGKFSKLLPLRVLSRYEEALKDPERLALDNEIALLDARLGDVLTRVDSGEALRHWSASQEALDGLLSAMRSQDSEGIQSNLRRLEKHIGAGVSDYAAWREVIDIISNRRKLVESERKRLMQMKALVDIREAVNYIRSYIEVVRGHVDEATMIAIQGDFLRIAAKTGDFRFDDMKPESSDVIDG